MVAVAKTSRLINSYRYYTVAVDCYENKRITGLIYHDSRNYGAPFSSLIDMVVNFNTIFDEIHYPRQAVDLRRFKGTGDKEPEARRAGDQILEQRKGNLATFRICIHYRYHASWQGELVWIEEDKKIHFDSFMNMVLEMDAVLENRDGTDDKPMSEKVCRVAVDGFEESCLTGQVQNLALKSALPFESEIGLLKHMEALFDGGDQKNGENQARNKVVSSQVLGAYRGGGKKATFVVRLLFKQHSTWQGSVYWRETGELCNFRSFLEMIMLMASALEAHSAWDESDSIGDAATKQEAVNSKAY